MESLNKNKGKVTLESCFCFNLMPYFGNLANKEALNP